MKLRTGDPWMPAKTYARSLTGLTLNFLVKDMERSLIFHTQVLGGTIVYSDPDFAVIRAQGSEWMIHADHTYLMHPMLETTKGAKHRGSGLEVRLHGRDPDAADRAARELGFTVLSPPTDKPHGVREAFLRDDEGYVWAPDMPTQD